MYKEEIKQQSFKYILQIAAICGYKASKCLLEFIRLKKNNRLSFTK